MCIHPELNTMMYVIIHELAHILCTEIGHTDLFDKINIRLLVYAMQCKVYKYTDYKKHHKIFGEIKIKMNILDFEGG